MHSAKKLGHNLFMARFAASVTPHGLAQLSGVDDASIRTYERGECFPSAESLERLAIALGVTPEHLLGQPLGTSSPRQLYVKAVGQRIAETVEARDLDRFVVARAAKVLPVYMRKYLAGRMLPTDVTFARLAPALGVTVKYLKGED